MDNQAVIHLFGRSESGERVIVLDSNFHPYFYVELKEMNETFFEELKKIKLEDRKRGICEVKKLDYEELLYHGRNLNLVKVYSNLPKAVPVLREYIKKIDFVKNVYEADIPFVRRYLIDKKITPMMMLDCTVEEKSLGYKAATYLCSEIIQINNTVEETRIIAVDIETYNPFGKKVMPEQNPILMIALYGNDIKKVITWKKFSTQEDYIFFVDSEAQLIEEFVKTIETYKPEIITGYFSDGFDLPYIKVRAAKYNIALNLGLDNSPMTVDNKGEFPTTQITGIVHLDIFKFVKKILGRTLNTDSYKLDPVAEELLNEKKDVINIEDLANVWDNKIQELDSFCKYNMQDAVLTYKLAIKIMPNAIELVKQIGITLFEINRMGFSQLVEWYLIKHSREHKQLVPNKPEYNEVKNRIRHSFEGAFVYEPKPGLYHNVAVFDFLSLYPTIISSHNIGQDTLNCSCCHGNKVPVDGKNYHFCKKTRGFAPLMIEKIIENRINVKAILKKDLSNQMLQARQNSLKLLANSFYGYLGFFNARWYCLECAESVTAYGRYYIKKSISDAEARGFKVLYTDTDSLFLWLENKSKQEALEFVKDYNETLSGLMELEFEGFYKSGIFVFTKSDSAGAKKKYALLSEKGDIKIRGFETVRRNWSPIAKEVQEKVLDIILRKGDGKEAFNYVKKVIEDLRRSHVLLEKVIMTTQLQKEIDNYDNVGPHVAAAKLMRARGDSVSPGTIIKFIIVRGDKILRDRVKLPEECTEQDYDSEYYVNNQIIPSVEKILNIFGYKKEDLAKSKSQSSLGDWF